jgi:hypothetical protein
MKMNLMVIIFGVTKKYEGIFAYYPAGTLYTAIDIETEFDFDDEDIIRKLKPEEIENDFELLKNIEKYNL